MSIFSGSFQGLSTDVCKKTVKYVQNAYQEIQKRLVKEMKFNVINVIIVVKNFNQKEDLKN